MTKVQDLKETNVTQIGGIKKEPLVKKTISNILESPKKEYTNLTPNTQKFKKIDEVQTETSKINVGSLPASITQKLPSVEERLNKIGEIKKAVKVEDTFVLPLNYLTTVSLGEKLDTIITKILYSINSTCKGEINTFNNIFNKLQFKKTLKPKVNKNEPDLYNVSIYGILNPNYSVDGQRIFKTSNKYESDNFITSFYEIPTFDRIDTDVIPGTIKKLLVKNSVLEMDGNLVLELSLKKLLEIYFIPTIITNDNIIESSNQKLPFDLIKYDDIKNLFSLSNEIIANTEDTLFFRLSFNRNLIEDSYYKVELPLSLLLSGGVSIDKSVLMEIFNKESKNKDSLEFKFKPNIAFRGNSISYLNNNKDCIQYPIIKLNKRAYIEDAPKDAFIAFLNGDSNSEILDEAKVIKEYTDLLINNYTSIFTDDKKNAFCIIDVNLLLRKLILNNKSFKIKSVINADGVIAFTFHI